MGTTVVKVKSNESEKKGTLADQSCEFEYDFGEDLAEASGIHGADVVFAKYLSGAKVEVQNASRNVMDANGTPEDAAATGASHTLGAKAAVDPVAKLARMFAKLSTEERAAFDAARG